MGIKSTQIIYHQGQWGENQFKSGDTVNGAVVVNIGGHKSHKLSALTVKVRGRAKTDWEENDDNYYETQDLFRLDLPLNSAVAGEAVSLPPGEHRLPFSFTLPERLPHSQKFEDAKVVYECKARLISEAFWSRNGLETTRFSVLPHVDLSQMPHLAEPLKVRREDRWTMWHGDPGEFTVTIGKQGFVAGETIDMWVDGNDKVFAELAQLNEHVRLKRLVVSRADKRENESREAVATVKPGNTPGAWHRIQLTVPENEITMDDETVCRIISVTYYVKISDIHLPVTLGTIPTRHR